MPPSVLLPMECRLGESYMDRGDADEAAAILIEGLESYPQDIELLRRLEKAFGMAGRDEQAADVREQIAELKAQ
jgi:Flp pilus assembly protein TadD